MSVPFVPQQGFIIVRAAFEGPSEHGRDGTLINVAMLVALGYDPALAPDRIQVTTGRGVEFAR